MHPHPKQPRKVKLQVLHAELEELMDTTVERETGPEWSLMRIATILMDLMALLLDREQNE